MITDAGIFLLLTQLLVLVLKNEIIYYHVSNYLIWIWYHSI